MQLGAVLFDTLLRLGCLWCDWKNEVVVDLAPQPPNPTVTTKYGKVEGFALRTALGFDAHIFLGIPYAKPPIGELRFEKPAPPTSWEKPFVARNYSARCATYPTYDPLESEDCLTLNVMTPTRKPPAAGFPVMVFIHGGGFITGSSHDYDYRLATERIVAQGIVLVTINYRLGPFGFYSTGNDFAPGNYGLWDQVAALQFVQDTISAFGGDPGAVTVFGESAGGASTSWLTLSPETEKLFVRSIPMSGSAQAIWANTDEVVTFSKLLTHNLDCDRVEDLKKCIQSVTTEEILHAARKFTESTGRADSPNFAYWNPRIDGDFLDVIDFAQAIKHAPKKSTFIGINSQEDIYFALSHDPHYMGAKYLPLPYNKALNFSRPDFEEAVRALLATDDAFGAHKEEAAKRIIEFYSQSAKSYRRHPLLQTFVQLFSDIHFNIAALREAKQKAAAGHEVYFYLFSYVANGTRDALIDGARHGADLFALMTSEPGGAACDPHVQEAIVGLFTTFARNGFPRTGDVVAERVQTDKFPFVEIAEKTTKHNDLWSDRVAFWDKLASDFGFDWPSGREYQ